ncbi:MAG: hypothetical protein WBM81_09065 [Sedimenticolaceae bacterium]
MAGSPGKLRAGACDLSGEFRARWKSETRVSAILRDARFGCRTIAQQINQAFGLDVEKDEARLILAKYY